MPLVSVSTMGDPYGTMQHENEVGIHAHIVMPQGE
jgi:hypothetical protein